MDLGPYIYYLSIKIERNRLARTLKISQLIFINKILAIHNMGEYRISPILMELNVNNYLVPAPDIYTADSEDVIAFKSSLGEINYLVTQIWPNIAFTANKLAIFSSNLNY